MADPFSTIQDEKRKFSWLGDPAGRSRGKGRARISADDARAMVDYNRDLVAPLDRGGGRAIRVNGQPARLSGSVPSATPTAPAARTVSGFETTDPAGVAGIASRYSEIGAASTFGAPGSPRGAVVNPNLPQPAATPAAAAPAPAVNPNLPTSDAMRPITDADVDNGGLVPVGGAGVPAADSHGAASTFGSGDGAVTNPNTGAPTSPPASRNDPNQNPALADWVSKGGSLATFHRAQVASGVRAPIDAHTDADPQGSTASRDIQQAHGWSGQGATADAQQIAKQMTGEFNANNAQSQAAWSQKFSQAYKALQETLNNNQ